MRQSLSIIASLVASSAFAVTPTEAIDFLYSSMSLPDKADYSREFYRENVDASLKAREEMPWGKIVPEREFLHFVLPVRVNNENLDMSRPAFYAELRDRVKNLPMKDAILEVNHWCHEKVTYKPSDGRTSSPLSSVSQAIGRCGEESTFTVAALRSVGIPARQIYTPRWAHTDDNHAWVEAWADGQWYFLGACEPEPVLNLAWFNDPASRGLLMSTNVAGDYRGPEEVLLKEPLTTRINVTSNYAPTATLDVKVVNPDGTPANGAKVNFCIYNYAEYYPAVTKKADADGKASLNGGLGDMIVWATNGTRYGLAKGKPGSDTLTVTLDKDPAYNGSFTFDIIPPRAASTPPAVTPSQRELNDLLMQHEDSIRNSYMATFATPEQARKSAASLNVNPDSLAKILTESRGNHAVITRLLSDLNQEKREAAISLLLNVSEKDRRDIPADVVINHVMNTQAYGSGSPWPKHVYDKYILNPRVELEYLTPWRKELPDLMKQNGVPSAPEKLAEWTAENILPADAQNPQRLRMSPLAVMKERKADALSRNIFFVAAARANGNPARIDPVTGTVKYMTPDMKWKKVELNGKNDISEKKTDSPKGKLMLTFAPSGHIVDPKYYSQFSISKISDGKPRQLEFDENGTFTTIFSRPVELEEGQYILTTGQRLANGGVLAKSDIFTITPGGTTTLPLEVRSDDHEISVIGSLNAENIYHDIASGSDKSILSTTGRGFYVLGLISPNHEPSAHALNDISAVASQLEASGRKLMLLFDNESSASRFRKENFKNLPSNVVFGIDNRGTCRNELISSLHLQENPAYPVFVVADTFNRVVWLSTGYTIGIGEQILSILSRLK